jgi:hypothetical protein
MARATTTREPRAKGSKTAGRVTRGAAKGTAKPTPASDRSTGRRATRQTGAASRIAAPAAPKMSKDELRAQLEKMERANANLRAKNRELKRAAGDSADRVAALEGEVARLERKVAAQPAPTRAPRRPRQRPEDVGVAERDPGDRDPGDAVPPGVAVQNPGPLSEDDKRVLEHLNEELGPEQDRPEQDDGSSER